tara:strand:+ start:1089 stop:1790 length:702 start_codon:yes stop_codon:yes gene_type:complete
MNKMIGEDSYTKEFKSKIINLDKENYLVELENTFFYGKGGGQPGDIGILITELGNVNVTETIKKDEKILHKVDSTNNLRIGEIVKGKLDWDKRYKFMKMHTALHLLCSAVPMGVTGGQIGEFKSRLDFNADANSINKEDLQKKLNLILKNQHEITYQWIDSKELEKKPELIRTMSVKPPKTNGKIRLVKIGNIDLQPCGGTHVNNTSEIGKIIVGKIENKGKMNRRINISLSD